MILNSVKHKLNTLFLAGVSLCLYSCASVSETAPSRPIDNPFGNFHEDARETYKGVTLKSSEGEKSFEVAFPSDKTDVNQLIIPMKPGFQTTDSAKSVYDPENPVDTEYKDSKPNSADREISGKFPQTIPEYQMQQREVESELGLIPTDGLSEQKVSYLAKMDYIRQLYKIARYEAAMIEVENLLRYYPTAPKLHEMRGTLLDKMGHNELAIQSWNQALKLDPRNLSLKKFIAKKQQNYSQSSGGTP